MSILNEYFQKIQEIVLPENSQKVDFINENIDDSLRFQILDDIINKIKILKNKENNNNLEKYKNLESKGIITDINRNDFLITFVKEAFKEKSKNEKKIKLKMFEKKILDLTLENKNFEKEIKELKNKIKSLNKKLEDNIEKPIKKNDILNTDNILKYYTIDINKEKNNNLENRNRVAICNNSSSIKSLEKYSRQPKNNPRLIIGKKINKKKLNILHNCSLYTIKKNNISLRSHKSDINLTKEYISYSIPKNNITKINTYIYKKK